MAAQTANNTSGERSATDYDRARFGQQREVWGSENTRSMTSANMNLSYVQRLRQGHDWVGVDKESIVHENEGMTSRVTLTHWKDHRIEVDAQRAQRLSIESQSLSQQWEEEKKNVKDVEHDKGEMYDALCTEKYSTSELTEGCIRLEEAIKKERIYTKKVERSVKSMQKQLDEEAEVTLRTKQRAEYLHKERQQRLAERDSLKCCATCCTACCWVENSFTMFFRSNSCGMLVGLSAPCRCGREWFCCTPEPCCQKDKVLQSLDPASSFRQWNKTLERIKRVSNVVAWLLFFGKVLVLGGFFDLT
jgi:hypothetical protein